MINRKSRTKEKILSPQRRKKVRVAPLTSEEHLKKTRKEVNRENRNRSKNHEREVAKLLGGSRTPMSGAHVTAKGDITIKFPDKKGTYLVECKLSAQRYGDIPKIRFDYRWLQKLKDEVKAMEARFGVFVLHYYNNKVLDDYVLIRIQDIKRIQNLTSVHSEALTELSQLEAIDIRIKNGKETIAHDFLKNTTDRNMQTRNGVKGQVVHMLTGLYLILYLRDFIDIMNGVNTSES